MLRKRWGSRVVHRKRLSSKELGLKRLDSKILRSKLIAYLGGKCSKCGFSDERALEIHHNKYSNNTDDDTTFLWKNKENLGDKVILLCANCHAILHIEIGKRKK